MFAWVDYDESSPAIQSGIGDNPDYFPIISCFNACVAAAPPPFVFLTAKGDKLELRKGMNLGADDYLTKPVQRADLLAAVQSRLDRRRAQRAEVESAKSARGFHPDFTSSKRLEALGLTEREAEVLLWVAQGKSNGDIAILLGMAEKTVRKHMGNIFEKLGVEGRNAATVRALEVLSQG